MTIYELIMKAPMLGNSAVYCGRFKTRYEAIECTIEMRKRGYGYPLIIEDKSGQFDDEFGGQ